MEVYRIQVTDGDSPGSPGWRAKFTLDGEKAENFGIEKNPKTNEGLLSVVKVKIFFLISFHFKLTDTKE